MAAAPCARHLPGRLVGAVVAAAVLVSGCASATDAGAPRTGDDAGPSGESAEMEHIHGLGVDPADGMLYAGSHYGLFRVPAEGAVTLVSPVQDLMGFTVAGPDRFLASGHPGEQQDGPSSVGLIESTDGGASWQLLSLPGEADFHSLEVVDETVFGLNSMTGTLMVSVDGHDWEARSTEPMADFAVDPENIDVVLSTTEQGPARSQDGARTFQLLSGAPLLVLVDWAADGTLLGVAPDGAVHVSTDAGTTWKARGRLPGAPEALHVEDADAVYAAAAGTVWESTDGGDSFAERPGTS